MPAPTCPPRSSRTRNIPPLRINQSYIDRLEGWCDEFNEPLPALNSFVLPGGTALSALLHVARTTARRAERSAWDAVGEHQDSVSVLPAKYLNRLSDLLFILSRVANPDGDVLWQPGGPGADKRRRSRTRKTCRSAARPKRRVPRKQLLAASTRPRTRTRFEPGQECGQRATIQRHLVPAATVGAL